MSFSCDIKGSAKLLAIAIPNTATKGKAASAVHEIGNLLDKLPLDCEVLWVYPHTPEAEQTIQNLPPRIRPLPLHIPMKQAGGHFRWIQDPFICSQTCLGRELVLPASASIADKEACFQIAKVTGQVIRPVDLAFEGGNAIMLGDYLLLGRDIAYQNGIPRCGPFLSPKPQPWRDLETRFLDLSGAKQIVWVGLNKLFTPPFKSDAMISPSWQPLFHIDLFLLPGGFTPQGHPRLFIADPLLPSHETCYHDKLHSLRQALEEVARNLLTDIPNLEIVSLPMVITFVGSKATMFNLCNGWVEQTHDRLYAYLPHFYGDHYSPPVKQALRHSRLQATEILEQLGFTTHFVEMNFANLLEQAGALHCCTKILDRS